MALVGQPIEISTASTTLLQVPATLEASLHSLLISNPTGGNLDVTLSFFDSGTSSELSLLTQTVSSDTTLKAFEAPINMAAGDKVNASATGTGLVALVSRFENSSTPAEVGFTARGNYTATTTYAVNDVVFLESDSNSYLSRTASNLNNVPSSNPSNWQIFGAKGTAGEITAAGTATLTNKTFGDATTFNSTISDSKGDLRDLQISQSSGSTYTLTTNDTGQMVRLNSAGIQALIPSSTFDAGDIVSIMNTTSTTGSITSQITMHVGGGVSATGTATLGINNIANIYFISGGACIVTGGAT